MMEGVLRVGDGGSVKEGDGGSVEGGCDAGGHGDGGGQRVW